MNPNPYRARVEEMGIPRSFTGYQSRCIGLIRHPDQSADWLAGWDLADDDLRGEVRAPVQPALELTP